MTRFYKTNVTVLTLGLAVALPGCDFLNTTTGKALMDYIMQALVLIVTPIVLLLVKRGIEVVEQKTGIIASQHQVELVDGAVYKGIAYAEEQARKALQTNAPAVTGNMKLQLATEFALDVVKNHNAAEIGRDYLVKMVEAHLNITRPEADKKAPNAPV